MELREVLKLILPKDKQEEILEIINMFKSNNFKDLFDKYKENLGLVDNFEDYDEFVEEIEDKYIDLEILIVWYMVNEEILLELDWSGEEENHQVENFINKLLSNVYRETLTVSVDEVYQMFEDDSINSRPKIKRGKHLPILFKYINNILKKYGYNLINVDINSDEYFIGVFREEPIKILENENFETIKIIDVDDI